MATESLVSVIEAAARCLEGVGFKYALVGEAAMPAWGRIRATQDADIFLYVDPSELGLDAALTSLVGAMRSAGFAHLEVADRCSLGDKQVLFFWFPFRPEGFSLRVDVLVSDRPLYSEIVERAVLKKIDGQRVPIASCEDLILMKLGAGRAVDIADARELAAINKSSIDQAYLRSRATAWGLSREIQEILDSIRD